ncbi:MAG: ribosome biogenesis GTP-binding protein YihA/YsxC [Sediminibacterium sp.]
MSIVQSRYLISSAQVDQCPQPDRPEYAFIGRSNVGKSSLINLLTGQKNLAKTSATPGKTQLINHFEIIGSRPDDKRKKSYWYLVDLPGYGYAQTAKTEREKWEKMIAGYLKKRKNLSEVLVLIDSRHSPQKIDREFINQLDRWRIPFSMVFTKTDKSKPGAVSRHIKEWEDELKKDWQFLPRFFVTSAIKKSGKEELLNYLEEKNLAWKKE